MNDFQQSTRRYVIAAKEQVTAIQMSIELAGVGRSNMREAYAALDEAWDALQRAADAIRATRNDGQEGA